MPFYDAEDRPVTAAMGETPLTDLTAAPAAQYVGPSKDYGIDYGNSPNVSKPSIMGASFRQDNIIGSIMSRKDAGITFDIEDGFNPFDKNKGTKYEQRPELFTDVFNSKALEARRSQIDMEDEDRAVMDRAGIKGMAASFMWQFFDPTILAPGGGLVKATRGGYSFAKSAASIGLAAAGGAALQEGILQSTQQTRPWEESAIAVGSSLVLGGLLGGTAAGLLSRAEARAADRGFRVLHQAASAEAMVAPLSDVAGRLRAGEQVTSSEVVEVARAAALQARLADVSAERMAHVDDVVGSAVKKLEELATAKGADDLLDPDKAAQIADQIDVVRGAIDGIDAGFGSAGKGAAAGAEFANRPTLDELSVEGPLARSYAAATKFLNPNLRQNFRAAVTARQYSQQLLENTVFQEMHANNKTLGPSVETMMRQEFRSRVIAAAQSADNIYQQARKSGLQMPRREFDEAVAKAMRREDVGENEFITKAAQSYRKEMFDHFKEMAQKTLGSDGKPLLPEDLQVVGAPSYLTRMANHERLTADEMGFKETVARYYEGVFRGEYEQQAEATRNRIAALEREIADLRMSPEDRAKTLGEIEQRLSDMETANAREIDLLSEINRYRQMAMKAGERGDKKAQKAAKEEASKLFEQGGDNLKAFLKERTALRQRQRRVDLNYAGMQEREDKIAQQIADIEERNLRAMTRLIDRGQKAEREFAKLDPAKKVEKIAALRTQFADVAARSEKAADSLAERAKALAVDEINALRRKMAEGQKPKVVPQQLRSGRALGAKPVSLVEFIKKNGGLPLDGEAKARNLRGGLAKADGKSIDGYWRESLMEHGYLPKEADGGMSRDITDELFAAIDKELRGQKVYSVFDQEAVARRMGAQNPDELDMLTSNVLGALDEVGIRGKEVDERALIDAAVAVAGNKGLDPLDAYEQAVIKLSREAEDKPVVNVEELARKIRGPRLETVEKRKVALAKSIQKNAVAERARADRLNAIARRLEEAEALDPEGQALELKRALSDLAEVTSGTSLDRGAKAQRLMDRAKALDPSKLDERIKTIETMRRDIEQEFYARWEGKRAGEGVDLQAPKGAAKFREYAEDVARQIYKHYTGRADTSGTVPDFAVPLATGPLKERTFNIPDKLIEPWLENDITRISERYARTMAAQIELTRKFGRADMKMQLAEIEAEYESLRERVGLAKTAEEALQIVGQRPGALDSFEAWRRGQDINKVTKERIAAWLDKDELGAKEDLEAARDLILGRYKMPENSGDYAKIASSLLAFNYVRAMGGAVIANLGDIYRSAMVNGLGRFMKDGVGPLLTNIEGFRASVKEAQLAGQVGEKWLHQRLATFAEIGDPYGKGTALQRFMENASRVASKWNGLSLFTDFSKSIASVTTQNRLIEAVSGGKEQRWLRWAGIDPFMEGRIKEQLATHGRAIDGVRVAETEKWTDLEAVRAYRAAVSKTVDTIAVERSVGDIPLFVNTPTGRLIAQFRTFNLAANQRVLLNGMQEDKARFVGSMVALTSIGMLVAALRSWRGGEERWEKFKQSASNPGFLIGEGLDNSGIFTIPFEIANTIEKLTQPSGFSFNPIKKPLMAAFPGKSQQGESTRFAARDPIGALLGPSAGLPMTLAKALGGDVKAGTQLLPFSTYPGMREAVQALTGDSPYGF